MPIEPLLAQWRLVNQQANEAERRVFEASLQFLRGAGPAPKEVDRVLAAQLRQEARTLFARALQAVDGAAAPARPGTNPAGSAPQPDAQSGGA